MLRTMFWIVSLQIVSLASTVTAAEYDELSLEELGEVEIFRASVLNAHIHKNSEWMINYSYIKMHMSSMGIDSNRLSSADVLQSYAVTPQHMDMAMHMLHLMYGITDEATLILMSHYMEKEMGHINRMGMTFNTKSNGIGDLTTALNYRFNTDENTGSYWVGGLGIIWPTGSIDEQDFIPMANQNQVLPYPMQLGSGSYALKTSINYNQINDDYSLGFLLAATSPLDTNDRGYRHNMSIDGLAWQDWTLSDHWTIKFSQHYVRRGSISGADLSLNPTIVPTADANNFAFQNLTLGLGIGYNLKIDNNEFLFQINYFKPVWQDLSGPQLQLDYHLGVTFEWMME